VHILKTIWRLWEAPFAWSERQTGLMHLASEFLALLWALIGLVLVLEVASRLVAGEWLGW
jgi:hypothetical protein